LGEEQTIDGYSFRLPKGFAPEGAVKADRRPQGTITEYSWKDGNSLVNVLSATVIRSDPGAVGPTAKQYREMMHSNIGKVFSDRVDGATSNGKIGDLEFERVESVVALAKSK